MYMLLIIIDHNSSSCQFNYKNSCTKLGPKEWLREVSEEWSYRSTMLFANKEDIKYQEK